jgi:pyruvate formate lyase activating enzyme
MISELGVRADYWEERPEKKVHCFLCPHHCVIAPGERGICRVRSNRDGVLWADVYGLTPSISLDPIEKKPLYHFLPGSQILSLGPPGCNLSCQYCQNWEISQQDGIPTRYIAPEELVKLAVDNHSVGISYTYTEPILWIEYIRDVTPLAKQSNLAQVLVTNGYITPEPLTDLLEWIDAANLDIKSLNDDYYRKLCGARVKPVLETARAMAKKIHLEITNLLVTGENDAPGEVARLAEWIATECSPEIPLHISRYFPHYKFSAPPTPPATLQRAYQEAKKFLKFVYVGNWDGGDYSDTVCPNCGNLLISRRGYHTEVKGLAHKQCAKCGYKVDIDEKEDFKTR